MQTGDGYLLGLHRLGWRKGEEGTRVNAGQESVKKKVVYLHHGLMMNSEVWVCLTEKERCLPFMLVEKGYDVWVRWSRLRHEYYGLIYFQLGNNRGNKYSKVGSCRIFLPFLDRHNTCNIWLLLRRAAEETFRKAQRLPGVTNIDIEIDQVLAGFQRLLELLHGPICVP